MTKKLTVEQYNYDVFHRSKFEPLMNFDASPNVGSEAPDFPLWNLDGSETSLSELWSAQDFLVVEFGSFT